MVVCKLCWDDVTKPLTKSFIKLNTIKHNYGNAQKHLSGVHKINDLSNTSSSVSITDLSSHTSSLKVKGGTINSLEKHGFKPAGWEDAHVFMYRFFNSAGQYQDYLIDNASALSNKQNNRDKYFTRNKYLKYQYKDFHSFLTTVQQLVLFTKLYYQQKCKTVKFPFLYILHDSWDSAEYNVLGVSVRFVVPKIWVTVNFALGLQRHDDKTSQGILKKILVILER